MLRAIIFIVIIINLGCNKKGDLSITESNPTDASVNFTDSLSNKMTTDSLKGEIYPVMLAPSNAWNRGSIYSVPENWFD
jgi:hypothetical protein